MILGLKLVFILESQIIFCPIRKALENNDLGKCHTIWARLHCLPKIVLAGTPMHSMNRHTNHMTSLRGHHMPLLSLKINQKLNYNYNSY